MNTQALLLELLVSGFFAIACFKARPEGDIRQVAVRPMDLLRLTDRITRLSRSRWQWFAMVGIIALVRMQIGVPMVVELTAAIQFIIFLALPVARREKPGAPTKVSGRSSRSKGLGTGNQRRAAVPASGAGLN